MKGISIVETAVLQTLIERIEELQSVVLNQMPDRYLSSKEAAAIIGFSEQWICNNKKYIGFSTIGTSIRFRLSDITKYMEGNYFKMENKRR